MDGGTTRAQMTQAVLDGVAHAFRDALAGAAHGPALGERSDFPRSHSGRVFEPRPALVRRHDETHARWSDLYPLLHRVPHAGAAAHRTDRAS